MLIVSDAHESENSPNSDEFCQMLKVISESQEDVIFLGDIMDLWVAIPGLEDDMHRFFQEWCRKEKARRNVIFVEGNHEFYVSRELSDCFTKSHQLELIWNQMVLTHGQELLETTPIGFNKIILRFCKSRLGEWIMHHIPCSRRLAFFLKQKLGSNGKRQFGNLPVERIIAWAEKKALENNAHFVLLGHFHDAHTISLKNHALCQIIPSWKNAGEIAQINHHSLIIKNWKEILL